LVQGKQLVFIWPIEMQGQQSYLPYYKAPVLKIMYQIVFPVSVFYLFLWKDKL